QQTAGADGPYRSCTWQRLNSDPASQLNTKSALIFQPNLSARKFHDSSESEPSVSDSQCSGGTHETASSWDDKIVPPKGSLLNTVAQFRVNRRPSGAIESNCNATRHQ
ncbi:unnamed protein product, partial [Amoebophrya sp. A120]